MTDPIPVRGRAAGELKKIITDRAVRRGRFVLAGGRTSNYYLNLKDVFHCPAGVAALRDAVGPLAEAYAAAAVGGPAVGALPLVTVSLVWAAGAGYGPLEGFYVRPDPKGHGASVGSLVEGRVAAGDRVVVLEDVFTTGASALRAVKAVEAVGAVVVLVAAVVDREEGAAETLSGYTVGSLFKVSDLGITPEGVTREQ